MVQTVERHILQSEAAIDHTGPIVAGFGQLLDPCLRFTPCTVGRTMRNIPPRYEIAQGGRNDGCTRRAILDTEKDISRE